MAVENLNQLFRDIELFRLNDLQVDEAIQACARNFDMDTGKAAENPFMIIAMYQAMGVVHMAQSQQAILAELKKIRERLEDLEKAVEASGNKISGEIDRINF